MVRFTNAIIAALAITVSGQIDDDVTDAIDSMIEVTTVSSDNSEPVTTEFANWEATLVWDSSTGTNFEPTSSWNKKFKEATQDPVGLPTTVSAVADSEGNSTFTIKTTAGWPIQWDDKSINDSKAISGNMAWSMVSDHDENNLTDAVINSWEFSVMQMKRGSELTIGQLESFTITNKEIDWAQNGEQAVPHDIDGA